MEHQALTRIAWTSRYLIRKVGWGRILAIALLVAAAALGFETRHLSADTERLRASLVAQPDRPTVMMVEAAGGPDTAGRLEAFYGQLPLQEDIPGIVKRLFVLAENAGILLARGEYRPVADAGAHLLRYQITLPVRAEAEPIHGFVIEALNQIPALALEGVSFKRETTKSGIVEARLRFELLAKLP